MTRLALPPASRAVVSVPQAVSSVWAHERFRNAASAPLASPRTCLPGPGQLTLVQTAAEFSIANRALVLTEPDTPAWGGMAARFSKHQGSATGVVARSLGCAVIADFTLESAATGCRLGFWPGTTLDNSPTHAPAVNYDSGDEVIYLVFGGSAKLGLGTLGDAFSVAVVPLPVGCAYCAKTVDTNDYLLVMYDRVGTTTPLYAGLSNYDAEATVKNLRLTGPGAARGPLLDVAAPVSGTSYSAKSEILIDVGVVHPGSLVAGERLEVRFRYKDSRNFWAIGTVVNGGGTAADYVIDVVENGTRRNVHTIEGVAEAGETVYLQAFILNVGTTSAGTMNWRATKTTTSWEVVGLGDADSTSFDSSTAIVPSVTGSGSLVDLLVYPSSWSHLGSLL